MLTNFGISCIMRDSITVYGDWNVITQGEYILVSGSSDTVEMEDVVQRV